jgi:hypothetical protein
MISLASIIKKMKSTSILGKSNLIKSYILSKLWYLAPVVNFTNNQYKKIRNLIKWTLFSKSTSFSPNDTQKGSLSEDRMSLPGEISFTNLPNIQARISSIKSKFIIEMQNTIMDQTEPLDHLYWLEYSIYKDMSVNKRYCPLFAIRNISNETPKSPMDDWIAQAHFSYQQLPQHHSTMPSVGDEVTVFQYSNAILPDFGRIVSINGNTVTIQKEKDEKLIDKDSHKVFDENIITPHLFYKWEHSETKKISKLIYQNCKNRLFLSMKGKKRQFLWSNKNNIITDKLLVKQQELLYTEGQTKNFQKFEINKRSLKASKKCRENIFSFHFKIFNNILPIFNEKKECALCKQHGLNNWHLFLECKAAKQVEKTMLLSLGVKENKIEKFIELRKKITREGSKKSELQNLMWTRNWAIWKFYNDYTHGKIKEWQNLEDILLVKWAMEEFRTLNFAKSLFEKRSKPLNKEWNNWTLIYKFDLLPNSLIIPKNKKIIQKFFIL